LYVAARNRAEYHGYAVGERIVAKGGQMQEYDSTFIPLGTALA